MQCTDFYKLDFPTYRQVGIFTFAEVQAGRAWRVCGGVGGAGPAAGLAPLRLVGAGRAQLALPAVAVVHPAGLARHRHLNH